MNYHHFRKVLFSTIIGPCLMILTLGLFCAHAQSEKAAEPYGLWLTENKRSAIKVMKCEENPNEICGKIAWIIDGGMQYDTENPDESLRGRPMCGIKILKGFEQAKNSPEKWRDGKIYKADEGDMYTASLTVLGEDKMRVRGYIGIPLFGKSQIWKKVYQKDYPPCVPAPKNKID